MPQTVLAQSTWNVGSGSFTTGGNWLGGLPGAGDTAIINGNTSTLSTTYTVNQMQVNGGLLEVVAGGDFTVTSGSTVAGGTFEVHGGATLNSNVSISSGIFNSNGTVNGNITQTGGANINTATVNGTLNVGGGTFTNTSPGTISGTVTITAGTMANTGTVGVVDNQAGGTFNNNAGGTAGTVTNNGTLTNGGTITTLNQLSGTFTNNVGGTIGGTLTVVGGTVNNAGTLGTVVNQAGGTFNNTGTAGAVTNNGTTTNTGTMASVNQVAGTFSNNAGGNVTGTVTLSGGSMTNAGTVNGVDIQSGNSFTNSGTAGTVTNRAGGTFVNNGTTTTVNNSGTGSNGASGTITTLNQIAGTFTNAAGSTITGTSTVSGGTLSNAGTLGAVTNQSSGTFTNTGTAGAVSNAGTATNSGTVASINQTAGTFTNNSGATVTGTTTISGGTLTNVGTLGTVNNQSGGTFTNRGTTGALTNAGDATNTGTIASLNHTSGTFSNAAGGTITGTVTIAGSTLFNNGSSLGDIQVLSGGVIKGAGSFGTITISSGATIAPGNSIGTSRISGNLVFENGSFYEVEVDPSGASDLITVTGGVTINGGTVTVLAGSGTYQRSTEYQIITSGTGVTGRFATITSNLTFLDPTLIYRSGNVYISLERNDIRFESVGHTPNQRSVGHALDSGWVPASVMTAATNLSEAGARSAFEDLSGDIYPSVSTVMLDESHHLRDALSARMANPVSDSPFWIEGYGSFSRHLGNGNATAVTTGSGGLVAGADSEIAEGWRLGAAGSYGYARSSTDAAGADADINSFSAAFYLEGEFGPLSLRSGASYSYHDVDVDRYLAFGGLSQQLSGAFDASTRQVFTEVAYGIKSGEVTFEPFVNLAFVDYSSDALRETGGDAALNVSGGYDHAIFSLLGVRVAGETTFGGMPVEFGGMLGWRHAHDAGGQVSRMNFAGQPGFDIGGVPVIEDQAIAEVSASFKIAPSAALELSWQGSFADKAFGQRAAIRLGVSF